MCVCIVGQNRPAGTEQLNGSLSTQRRANNKHGHFQRSVEMLRDVVYVVVVGEKRTVSTFSNTMVKRAKHANT